MGIGEVPVSASSARDPRIDFLRGVALLTIFIDHVPGNFLGTLTVRNFGFADAAELFVLLAGVSSTLAYGKQFERVGAGRALRRVAGRCLRIYLSGRIAPHDLRGLAELAAVFRARTA